MILNNAENIMSGSAEVSKVFCGVHLVWSRNSPVNPISNFELDVTRFDAANPIVYDTNGNIIGEIIPIGGSVSNCQTTNDGLEVSGSTSMRIAVNLPKSHAWTIIYRIKYFNNNGDVVFVFDTKNEELETCKNNSIYGIRHKLGATELGDNYTLLNNAFTFESNNVQAGIWDEATRTTEMQYYEMDYRWVCNGTTLLLFVNGVKKIETSLEHFPANLAELGIPDYNSNDDSSAARMTITKLQVLDSAVTTPSHVVYKWSITDFRGANTYFQFARLCLYANQVRLDQEAGCVAACWVDEEKPTYSSDNETVKMLTGDRNGKMCAERGGTQDIYFSVPYSSDPVDEYSYITANDEADRDPVSWNLYKSIDGAVTWRLLDSKTDIADPGRGQETDIWEIDNPEPPDPDPDQPIPGSSTSKKTGLPPITYPSDGSNLRDWEIIGRVDSETGVGVGIAHTNLFLNHVWETCFRQPYPLQGTPLDRKLTRNYFLSTYDVIPVSPETTYTLSFTNGNVTDYGNIYITYYDNTVTNTVEPTEREEGMESAYIAYTWINMSGGKTYGTFTTPTGAAYIRIVVGNENDPNINTTYIGNTMLNITRYPFPYIETPGQVKYAIPVVNTCGSKEFFHVFSLAQPLGTGETLDKSTSGVDFQTFDGTNTITVDCPTLPYMSIVYNETYTNLFNTQQWLNALYTHIVIIGGVEYHGYVGGTVTPVTGGFRIDTNGLQQTTMTLSAQYPSSSYGIPIAVESGKQYTLSWQQDASRSTTFVAIYNGSTKVAETRAITERSLTFTAPSDSICILITLANADTDRQSVTYTNWQLK